MSSGAALDSLTLDGHGMQPPASFGNAVRRTWTLRPSPASARVALTSLTLRYTDETLGTTREDSLHVYHSDDAGATWRRLSTSTNFTRDLAGNAVTITNAPAYGTYVLSSRVDAVTAAPNLVVSLAGPERIRVGPPNTYLLHYENTGTARLGDFFLSLRTTGGIYIDHILPSSQRSGAPQPIRPAQFSTSGDNTYAVFWVEGLNPGESRTMTAVVKTTADIQGLAFNPRTGAMEATVKGQILPALVAGAAIGLGGAAATGFAGDVATGILAGVLANPDRRTAQEQQAVVLDAIKGAIDDWTGGPEKGMSTFSDHVAGKLGSKLGNPIAAAADLANNAGQLSDAVRAGQDRMAAAGRIPGDFTPGGPFGNGPGRQPIRFPDPPPATPSPVRSWDPNEKNGPQGVGEAGFVSSLGRMTYQIKFENKKEAIGRRLRDRHRRHARRHARPRDRRSTDRRATRSSSSPARATCSRGGAVGIELPPNVNAPEGEGYRLVHRAGPPDLPSGTSIANRAKITFDLNEPIVTNTHVNTLDLTAPVTAMRACLPKRAGSRVVVRWSASRCGRRGAARGGRLRLAQRRSVQPMGTSLGRFARLRRRGGAAGTASTSSPPTPRQRRGRAPGARRHTPASGVATADDAPGAAGLALRTVYPNPARGAAPCASPWPPPPSP